MRSLNEDRIILMTRMASYEASEQKKLAILKYFRSDYVTFNMLRTAVYYTIAFAMVAGISVFCNIEDYLSDFYQTDWQSILRSFITRYLVLLAAYLLFSFVLYSYRYTKAKGSVHVYQRSLKRLINM